MVKVVVKMAVKIEVKMAAKVVTRSRGDGARRGGALFGRRCRNNGVTV